MQQTLTHSRIESNKTESVKIISVLYDGAISFISIAKKRLHENDMAGKGFYLAKATAIVGELSSSLNIEDGGEIAGNLRMLYDYVLDRLLAANANNDPAMLDEAGKILDILRSAWKEIENTDAIAA